MFKISRCAICGTTFFGKGLYCGSEECKRIARNQRAARYREKHRVAPLSKTSTCIICGCTMEYFGKERKYCSQKCETVGGMLRQRKHRLKIKENNL